MIRENEKIFCKIEDFDKNSQSQKSPSTKTHKVKEKISLRGLVSGYKTAMPCSLAGRLKDPFSAPCPPYLSARPGR